MTNFKKSVLYIKYHNGPEVIAREKKDSIIVCNGHHHFELSDHGRNPDGACCCQSRMIKAIAAGIAADDFYAGIERALS